MEKRTKNILIIAGIALALVLAIYFIGKASGRKKEQVSRPGIKDFPNSGSGIPQTWDPNVLADKLHDLMEGLFDSPVAKEEAFGQLANLATDDMVVAVYNTFNSKYSKEPGDTLSKWIREEAFVGDFWNLGNLGVNNQELALNRLEKLNLP